MARWFLPVGGVIGGIVMTAIGVFIPTRPGFPTETLPFIVLWIGWVWVIERGEQHRRVAHREEDPAPDRRGHRVPLKGTALCCCAAGW